MPKRQLKNSSKNRFAKGSASSTGSGKGSAKSSKSSRKSLPQLGKLRIVGGTFGGRQITYSGDPVTRPMKDDIREAVFNLIGGWVPGKAVFDLFAGTGAMGLEALSRGASQAFLIERHFPTIRIIRENVLSLGNDLPVKIASEDTFFWTRQFLKNPDSWPTEPWVVFVCPPYKCFVSQKSQVLQLIQSLFEKAPEGSLFVVESDDRFDPALLPSPELWRTRQYTPALVSVFRDMKGQNAPPLEESQSDAEPSIEMTNTNISDPTDE